MLLDSWTPILQLFLGASSLPSFPSFKISFVAILLGKLMNHFWKVKLNSITHLYESDNLVFLHPWKSDETFAF